MERFVDSMLNKVVVITGGGGFLGRRFVEDICRKGGTAIAADIDYASVESLSSADGIYPVLLDITSKESVSKMLLNVQSRYGKIDAIVNNAYPRNASYGAKLEDVIYEDFCENTGMHLGGYFLVSQLGCNLFKAQGHGNLINLSSIYGVMAPRFSVYDQTPMTMPVEYAAIKSAVVHLTKYFAAYYKGQGIRVNCISPGGILDKQPEQFLQAYNAHCNEKGMLDPADVSNVLMFLLSDDSRYMTGQNIIVDDGFSL